MSKQEKKVFLFNGYGSYGGAYMLYQVGRICFEEFGTQVFIIQNSRGKKRTNRFHYPHNFPTLTITQMYEIMTINDLFFCNPVFSYYSFGSKLPVKKVMYLQGVNTYSNLDMNFDYYVSVSQFVQEHVKSNFDVESPVINPFIDLNTFNKGIPWRNRTNQILVLDYKKETMLLYKQLIMKYKLMYPQCSLKFKKVSNLSQKELAAVMGKHKYYLTLSPVEGFGLPPLEAMASGCAVLGFDGYGGREYFNSTNSFTVRYGNFNLLISYLREIEKNADVGLKVSKNAITTAQKFSYDNFKEGWTKFLMNHGLI